MAWWQKKLLHYALSRTGLLDDKAIDPKNLDITLGRTNVVELKDVGLNIKRISQLAQLPSSLRVEAARVLSLRLTVPADIYQSSIVAEVDGVELSVRLDEAVEDDRSAKGKSGARSPVNVRSPQHRKVHRRIHSPPPYDSGGLSGSEDDGHIPTTQEMAKSFLQDEPAQERRQLEASMAAGSKGVEESIVSESSEGEDVGTGAAVGLPGFLANFLQGIVDRLKVQIKNLEVRIETEVAGDGQEGVPVTLRLRVGAAGLEELEGGENHDAHAGKRHVRLQDISVDLLSDATIFSELSELPSRGSPTDSKRPSHSSPPSEASRSATQSRVDSRSSRADLSASAQSMHASADLLTRDLFTDAQHDIDRRSDRSEATSDLDIQPGDDNISWGSRRSRTSESAPAGDLWNSMASEDDLPDSLLLERAATPRPRPSPRNTSPAGTRTRRTVSPYDRAFQSPGSWPRMDESPERRKVHISPGSWPAPDQSQHSMYQPLTPGPAFEHDEDPMDNKRVALEASAAYHQAMPPAEEILTPPEPESDEITGMAQSRFYSHEEAESMYMSAMGGSQSMSMHVPGGWSAESERSESPEDRRNEQLDGSVSSAEQDDKGLIPQSGHATPRAQSPEFERTPPKRDDMAAKRLVFVDEVSVWLPNTSGEPAATDIPIDFKTRQFHAGSNSTYRGVPGTFSAYSELSASRRPGTSSTSDDKKSALWSAPKRQPSQPSDNGLVVDVGTMTATVDLASCRLLYSLATTASHAFKQADSPPASAKPRQTADTATSNSSSELPIALTLQKLQLSLLEQLPLTKSSVVETGLIAVTCENASLNVSPGEVDLQFGRLRAVLSGSELLVFDRQAKLSSSIVLTESTPDVSFLLNMNKVTIHKRPVTEITMQTLPIKLGLDLSAIDDTLSSFGGLSGILELSGSMLSEGGMMASRTPAGKSSKGVRFQGDPVTAPTGPELKANARIGGADVTLRGEACAVNLRTTTLKAVYREQGAVVAVEHVALAGPYTAGGASAPLTADLSTLRLEYLLTPQDKDLERLLSLLIPSKDKYDSDDDILIDTLLRQRRKGSLARASVGDVKVKVAGLDFIQLLAALGGELSKLSVVAKYLPEDERPGLLTLVRVKAFEAQLPVNDRFGKLQVGCQDFHCAHVGLPALLALSVGSIQASRMGYATLVHPLIPLMGADNLPMLMARMLGDEAEPTVKVKLFNICFEYSVPTILALTGMDVEAAPAEMMVDLARSVTNFATMRQSGSKSPDSPTSSASRKSVKRTNIDLIVHDSALGLTPERSPAKGLLILTDVRFSTLVPPEAALAASLELRKAALFLTDDANNTDTETLSSGRGAPNNTTNNVRLAAALTKQGYVSVGSIMSAKMAVKVENASQGESKSVDMDVRNELLLLETCADSTQTLFAILGGLGPPTPPSKQPKYLTEPMTIEDMMASFTGEPEAKPVAPSVTLFDVDEELSEDDMGMLPEAATLGNDLDDLLAESEMTQSLYGPVSGILGGRDDPDEEDEPGADASSETVESLLEDDPFEMTITPTDVGLSDTALMRDLVKQCKPAVSGESVDLGLYEIEDLGFDALGTGQQALGSRHRFNTPAVRGRKLPPSDTRQQKLPFKLRLRDLHVIWNIHDGYDWQRTRDGITEAVEQVEARAEERKARRRQSLQEHEDEQESVIGDVLFNSIYIGVPANHDAQELRRHINRGIDDMASETESVPLSGMSKPTVYSASGRPMRQRQRRRLKLERSKAHKVAFELKGVSADMHVFPPDTEDVVSSVDVRIRDFEIFDNVPTSTWRKFLTRLQSDPATREMAKPMVHLELLNVRTLENYAASEMIIHASLLPLRLHVDQDALDFITRSFNFKDDSVTDSSADADQPFIQRLEVDTVDLKLDYKPKRIDYGILRSGNTSELMNLMSLDAADIKLKHTIVYGLRGFAPLHKTLNDVWMPDVTRNQLPTVLSGLAPIRSLANIGNGMRDVIAIPVREYKKDGRVVRSIQKGALHFGKTTTSELARLGAKLAIGTQNLLSGAEGLLSPASASPSGRPGVGRRVSSDQGWHDMASGEDEESEQRAFSAYANQPLGVFSGLRTARRYLEHDLLTARDAFIAVQGEIFESSSPTAAAAAVARRAPTVILRPVIGASRAVGTALLGVGNQIDRSNVRKVEDVSPRPVILS